MPIPSSRPSPDIRLARSGNGPAIAPFPPSQSGRKISSAAPASLGTSGPECPKNVSKCPTVPRLRPKPGTVGPSISPLWYSPHHEFVLRSFGNVPNVPETKFPPPRPNFQQLPFCPPRAGRKGSHAPAFAFNAHANSKCHCPGQLAFHVPFSITCHCS